MRYSFSSLLYWSIGAIVLFLMLWCPSSLLVPIVLCSLLFSYATFLFFVGKKNTFALLLFLATLLATAWLASKEVLLPSLLSSLPIGLLHALALATRKKSPPVAVREASPAHEIGLDVLEKKLDLAHEHAKKLEELLSEKRHQMEECAKTLEATRDEKEQLKKLLEIHKSDAKEKEFQDLYAQLKEQHAQMRQELENARHASFLEQLRADTLERQVNELDLQLTESSCSDLMKLIKQYSEEHTQLIVTHHRDMVEYELLIQALLLELEKSAKPVAMLIERVQKREV